MYTVKSWGREEKKSACPGLFSWSQFIHVYKNTHFQVGTHSNGKRPLRKVSQRHRGSEGGSTKKTLKIHDVIFSPNFVAEFVEITVRQFSSCILCF